VKVLRLKASIAGVAAVTVLTAVVAVVSGAADGIAFFGTGADPAAALKETAIFIDGDADVAWQPDAPNLPRRMEEASRVAIAASYLAAWNHRTTGGDADYLAGPAAAAAAAVPSSPPSNVTEVDLSHDLRLEFYSADGQLVAFTDDAVVARGVALSSGEAWSDTAPERYVVVMILVDGNWRLRHWVRSTAR
jgi:hypothetical protein